MKPHKNSVVRSIAAWFAVLTALAALAPVAAHGAEVIPSYGLTRSTDSNTDAKSLLAIAVRGNLSPLFQTELGVAYRSESRFDGDLKVRMWPVTASLYLTPVPTLYAGAGVGWYQTTFDYASTLPFPDETKQEFGVHVGGGFQIPLAPSVAADLGGRYVMMRDQQSRLVPEKFNPDFWTTQLGLAFKF